MTSLYSNVELLYSMPGVGATKSTTAQQVVTGTGNTGPPPYLMPGLASIWPAHQIVGKAFKFTAKGTYDAGAVTNLMQLYADTAQATPGVLLAASGTITLASQTTGTWDMDVDLSCVASIAGSGGSSWVAQGKITYGTAANTAIDLVYTVGGANALGVPTYITLLNYTPYYFELYSTFGTSPTAFVCSQFKVYAEN